MKDYKAISEKQEILITAFRNSDWRTIDKITSELSALQQENEPEKSQDDKKEESQWHLNCTKCQKSYWDKQPFPIFQICPECKRTKSHPDKEPSMSDACDNWMPDREIFYKQSCAFCGSEYYSLERIPKFDACSKCDTDGVNKEVIFNFKQSIRLLKKEAERRYANADHKEDRIKAFIDGGNCLKYRIPVTDKMIDKLLNDYESYSGTFISKESIKKYIKQRHNG